MFSYFEPTPIFTGDDSSQASDLSVVDDQQQPDDQQAAVDDDDHQQQQAVVDLQQGGDLRAIVGQQHGDNQPGGDLQQQGT